MVPGYLAADRIRRSTIPAATTSRARPSGMAVVLATTFRNFPSFPQRYMETVDLPPRIPACGGTA